MQDTAYLFQNVAQISQFWDCHTEYRRVGHPTLVYGCHLLVFQSSILILNTVDVVSKTLHSQMKYA